MNKLTGFMLNTRTRLFFAFLKYAALVPLAPSNRTIGSGSPRLRPTKQLALVPPGSDQPNNWHRIWSRPKNWLWHQLRVHGTGSSPLPRVEAAEMADNYSIWHPFPWWNGDAKKWREPSSDNLCLFLPNDPLDFLQLFQCAFSFCSTVIFPFESQRM